MIKASPKILMLTGGGDSTKFMYNGLKDEFSISKVIIEQPVDRKTFITRRIKKLGLISVLGQVWFQLFVPKALSILSKKRVRSILDAHDLDQTSIPESDIFQVPSVNSDACIEFLKQEQPDVVVVNGTRIIAKKVLEAVDAKFINTHVGITPRYRGVHGGYWALANSDEENCGVTVHLVDAGIDTGGVLYQQNIEVTKSDNFSTYPLLQLAEGIKLMKKAIQDFSTGHLNEQEPQVPDSKLWHHPTWWYYWYKRITKGVK